MIKMSFLGHTKVENIGAYTKSRLQNIIAFIADMSRLPLPYFPHLSQFYIKHQTIISFYQGLTNS